MMDSTIEPMPPPKSRFADIKRRIRKVRAAKKSTLTEDSPAKPLGFLDLPGEIRNQIYGYAIPRKERVLVSDAQPGLIRTCRQVRAETWTMYYKKNIFVICARHRTHMRAARVWFALVYPTVIGVLKEMEIRSCNVTLHLRRIPGTEKWSASASAGLIQGKLTPLTARETFRAMGEVFGATFTPVRPGHYGVGFDLGGVQDLIRHSNRYDEYADRHKLEKLGRPFRYPTGPTPRQSSVPQPVLDWIIFPLIAPAFLVYLAGHSVKKGMEKVAWKLKEPDKDFCKTSK